MSEIKSSSNPFETSGSGLISESNYRTLVSEMMLSVRIRTPVHLQNRTVGQHVAEMDWLDSQVGRTVQVGHFKFFFLPFYLFSQCFIFFNFLIFFFYYSSAPKSKRFRISDD